MNNSIRNILFFIFRIFCYSLIMIALNLIYSHDATYITSTGKFGENSWTEIVQEVVLFMAGVVFIIISRKNQELNVISNLIAIFFFIAFIREFNNQIPFWFYLEIPLILVFAWLLFHNRQRIIVSAEAFIMNPVIAWFITGFLVTFVFSRFFGRTVFWKTILEGDYNRWAKNAAEEGIELLGYTLFLFSAVELLVQVLRNNKPAGK
jgi:hypothetical protein